jgi:cytochrome c oxidase subunit 2
VQKGWSIFFGVVLMATFLIWFAAPLFGWWLPENVSTYGGEVDYLFYVILGFTAFFFVLTEVILVYGMWKYVKREGEKSHYTHGNHRLEMVWTAIPAGILLFIAFAQVNAWGRIKYNSRMPSPDLTIAITARQWEWRMRYPWDEVDKDLGKRVSRFHYDKKDGQGVIARKQLAARAWAENQEADDVHVANEIHCWVNTDEEPCNVKAYLRTLDVLHSFTMPNLRLKQDTVPGKTIPIWFAVTRANTEFDPKTKKLKDPDQKKDAWEIACQELCGGRHYAMRGRLYVHKNRASYEAWLQYARQQQQTHEPEKMVAQGN